MSSEKGMSNRILVDRLVADPNSANSQIFQEYRLPTELPEDTKKRANCLDHIQQGASWELTEKFYSSKVCAPREGEPHEITTKLSCEGLCALGKCGLTITQYNHAGLPLAKMHFEE